MDRQSRAVGDILQGVVDVSEKERVKREKSEARKTRSAENRRGRIKPARVPARLARTSAFAPRRTNLNTDSDFERTYIVPGYSVIHVKGRELGSQHRDAVYAVFRLKAEEYSYPNPKYDPKKEMTYNNSPLVKEYEINTTWRELLLTTGKTDHKNNLKTLLDNFQDLQKVVIQVQVGNPSKIQKANALGEIGGPGWSDNIVGPIIWDGVELDSRVVIKYSEFSKIALTSGYLVSLNAEVQFRLKNDHAKSFWPFIDSQPQHTFILEDTLAALAGIDVSQLTPSQKRDFRSKCRDAFNDMVKAGGLSDWEVEVTKSGKLKSRKYSYLHALPRQVELKLDDVDETKVENAIPTPESSAHF